MIAYLFYFILKNLLPVFVVYSAVRNRGVRRGGVHMHSLQKLRKRNPNGISVFNASIILHFKVKRHFHRIQIQRIITLVNFPVRLSACLRRGEVGIRRFPAKTSGKIFQTEADIISDSLFSCCTRPIKGDNGKAVQTEFQLVPLIPEILLSFLYGKCLNLDILLLHIQNIQGTDAVFLLLLF